ncbi:MAG: AraC family transcriptional regulator [Ruminococcaceae bacterium]|nr:AraC family transcriptional regulator [Oscillospiraceae bacterium]
MKDGTLLLAWQTTRTYGEYIEPNQHDHHEVVYFLSGSGEMELDGQIFSFSQGDFACIPQNTPHRTAHLTESVVLYIRFTGFCDLPCCLLNDSARRVERLLRDVLHEMQEQPFNYTAMVALKLHELPILIHRYCHPHHTAKNFEYIVNFLRENYHEKLRLADCAAQLHVSYDYFQHKFKAYTGVSPQQFLIEQRLLGAEKMLRETALSCTEIAFRCGFSTSAQFSALFKQKYGVPPLRFRRRK